MHDNEYTPSPLTVHSMDRKRYEGGNPQAIRIRCGVVLSPERTGTVRTGSTERAGCVRSFPIGTSCHDRQGVYTASFSRPRENDGAGV